MSKGEIQYFLTFAAGMAAFWLSGVVTSHLPVSTSRLLVQIAAAAVYGAGMLLLSAGIYGRSRSLKGALVATAVAVALALVGAQVMLQLVGRFIHPDKMGFAIFNFIAYLAFGLFYVVSAWVGRRVLH